MATVAAVPNSKPQRTGLQVVSSRPSIKPEKIDDACQKHLALKIEEESLDARMKDSKELLLKLIRRYGSVPSKAMKSRRLDGAIYYALATFGSTTTIHPQAVEALMLAIVRSKLGPRQGAKLFDSIFEFQPKYAIRPDAAKVLCDLPVGAPRNLRKLFAKTFDVKPKHPSVTVEELKASK